MKPLKDKETNTVLHSFIDIVNESRAKRNKSWIDQGR